MKTIDILQEQWQLPAAVVGAHAAALWGLNKSMNDRWEELNGKKKPEDTPVKPTQLEKPADPKKPSKIVKPGDSLSPGEEIIPNTVKDNKDMDPTSDKSVHGKLFHDRLQSIAKDLGVSSSDLLRIMEFESKMDPAAENPKSHARGLIQFMPKTALSAFGKTADWIATLSAYDQLLYVWDFYRQNKLPRGSKLGDIYLVTFMPAALGKPDNFVLGKKGAYKQTVWDVDLGLNWDQNDQFASEAERNGRNYFTVGDVKKVIQTKH